MILFTDYNITDMKLHILLKNWGFVKKRYLFSKMNDLDLIINKQQYYNLYKSIKIKDSIEDNTACCIGKSGSGYTLTKEYY